MRTIFFGVLLAASGCAVAANCTINASSTWTGLTATCGFTPGAADSITVKRGATLTVNTTGTCGTLQLGDDTGATGQRGNGTLVFNASTQLTCASVVLGDNTNGGARTGTITMANAATLITDGFTVNVFGGWTPSTGTVQLQATNTLPTAFNTNGYNNLTVTAGTTTSSGTVTVAGALSVASSSTLALGANTLNVGGNLTVNGTVSGSAPINLTGAATIDGTGSVTNTGTLTLSTGAKTIASTANLSFSGPIAVNITTTNNGTVSASGTVTLGAVTFTNNASVTSSAAGGIVGVGGSTWTNAANSSLSVSGPLLATGTLTATASPNTVTYAGAAQTIKVPSASYNNLTLSGSGTKTPAGSFTTTGTLTIGSGITLAGGTLTLTVNGNVSNSGTHTASTGTITLSGGSAAHTLTGSGTYANLVMNDANGATLSGSPTVSGTLTLTSGVITTGGNTLITSANCPGSISRTSGHINGNLQLRFPTGAPSCAFHVGDSSNYTSATITFTNVSAAGSLIASATSVDYSDAGSPIDTTRSVNRYWTVQLPGSGALSFTGSYSAAFTYVVTDNDGSTTPAQYVIGKGDSCSPNCTWTLPTVSGTPTTTSATATGMTSFSVFAIGHIKIAHFAISVPSSPFTTCNAASVTITAQDSGNATVTNYNGTVNITTSSADGDWSLTTGNGTLTNSGTGASGVADDGKATYSFTPSDNGVVTLSLSNILVNSDVTITVVDSGVASSSTTSSAIQYRGNQFAITNDTVQVAGKPQTITITRQRGASCNTTLTEYAGNKNLKAWYTTDTDHPAGATAPAITGASPAITTSVPASNNLANLNFTNGVATVTLTTSDVGKYTVNVRDDASGNVDGTSPTITTRPFALVVSGIKQGATNNPSGTATAGTKFVAAGSSFEATVSAYLWSSTADSNVDGVPDGGATVAQITAGGAAPRFAWATTLAAATPITPAGGTTGTLGNGSLLATAYSGGSANPNTLSYSEAGSFTMTASVSTYLNTGGANFSAGAGNAIVVDGSGGRTGVVGRVFPDHFTLVAGSTVTAGCAAGGFTYMGHGALGYSFTVEARNASDIKTNNYTNTTYSVGTVSLQAENNNSGTDLSARLAAPGGSWSSGAYAVTTSTATFSRPSSPDGPFELLAIGVSVSDADGAVLANRDMNPTNTSCTAPTCTATAIGTSTRVRFGRLREQNAVASSGAITLPVPVTLQHWDGSVFRTNSDDSCTTIAQASVTLDSTGLTGGTTSVLSNPVTFTSGTGFIRLDKPGTGASGFVVVTPTVPSYLQGNWTGAAWDQNPSARAAWGVFGSQPPNFVFQRENY